MTLNGKVHNQLVSYVENTRQPPISVITKSGYRGDDMFAKLERRQHERRQERDTIGPIGANTTARVRPTARGRRVGNNDVSAPDSQSAHITRLTGHHVKANVNAQPLLKKHPPTSVKSQFMSLLQHMSSHVALCLEVHDQNESRSPRDQDRSQRGNQMGTTTKPMTLLHLMLHYTMNPVSTDASLTTAFLLNLANSELAEKDGVAWKSSRSKLSSKRLLELENTIEDSSQRPQASRIEELNKARFSIFWRNPMRLKQWVASEMPLELSCQEISSFAAALAIYCTRCDVQGYFKGLWAKVLLPAAHFGITKSSKEEPERNAIGMDDATLRGQFVSSCINAVRRIMDILMTDDALANLPSPAAAMVQFLLKNGGVEAVDVLVVDLMIIPAILSLLDPIRPLPRICSSTGERRTWLHTLACLKDRLANPSSATTESNTAGIAFFAWYIIHTSAKPLDSLDHNTPQLAGGVPESNLVQEIVTPEFETRVRTVCDRYRPRFERFRNKICRLSTDAHGTSGLPPSNGNGDLSAVLVKKRLAKLTPRPLEMTNLLLMPDEELQTLSELVFTSHVSLLNQEHDCILDPIVTCLHRVLMQVRQTYMEDEGAGVNLLQLHNETSVTHETGAKDETNVHFALPLVRQRRVFTAAVELGTKMHADLVHANAVLTNTAPDLMDDLVPGGHGQLVHKDTVANRDRATLHDAELDFLSGLRGKASSRSSSTKSHNHEHRRRIRTSQITKPVDHEASYLAPTGVAIEHQAQEERVAWNEQRACRVCMRLWVYSWVGGNKTCGLPLPTVKHQSSLAYKQHS